jgi:hypothetical protein
LVKYYLKGDEMRFKAKRYYSCEEELKKFQFKLKQTPCPHCRSTGFLNLHGYLRGYAEDSCKKVIRGRRIFCNNRGHRTGCGRTFSILAAKIIKKFLISAASFWFFLYNISSGLPKIQAFKVAGASLTRSSCYRIWKLFELGQTKIRSKLLNLCSAPMNSLTRTPQLQTIMHLKRAFPSARCPISAFQNHFQVSL